MINTLTRSILFVSLFYDVDSTAAVDKAVRTWQRTVADGNASNLEVTLSCLGCALLPVSNCDCLCAVGDGL